MLFSDSPLRRLPPSTCLSQPGFRLLASPLALRSLPLASGFSPSARFVRPVLPGSADSRSCVAMLTPLSLPPLAGTVRAFAVTRLLCPRLTSARCSGRLAASPVAISATTRRPPEVSSAAFRAPLPEFTLGALDGYGLRGELSVRPTLTTQIRFLYIRSRVCSTLLSDPPSPERPCASLTLHLHQVG